MIDGVEKRKKQQTTKSPVIQICIQESALFAVTNNTDTSDTGQVAPICTW